MKRDECGDLMNLNALIPDLMNFLFIFIFSFLGAIIKDTYETLTGQEPKVKVQRIMVSSIVSCVILFSLSDFILAKLSMKEFILPCFIGGVVGFEVFGKINKVSFWYEIIKNRFKL